MRRRWIKRVATVAFMIALLSPRTSYGQAAGNVMSCSAVMCLYGRVSHMGGNQPQCKAPISTFFAIRVFGFPTGYLPGATSRARHRFLQQCTSAMSEPTDMLAIEQIILVYGTLMFDPGF